MPSTWPGSTSHKSSRSSRPTTQLCTTNFPNTCPRSRHTRQSLDHPLAAESGVEFDQLASEDLIAYRENSAIRRRLERKMADRGLEPRNAFICTEMAAVRALASRGLGVAVMPRSVAEQAGPPIELRPLAPERLTWPVALVWRTARRQ